MAPRLNVIIGSTRPGRVGPTIARWFEGFARDHGKFDVALVDLLDFALPVYDEPNHPRLRQYTKAHTDAWSKSVDSADAFVFVTPEYNYSTSPALINAIDFVFHEWACKPAGIVSYGGASGGMRSAQMLKLMLTSVRVMPLPDSVAVHNVRAAIDEAGKVTANELMLTSAKTMLDELFRWAEALKPLRAK